MTSLKEYFDEITDIVVCSGSGGTGLDLALANYWTGSKKKIHGVRAWGDSKYFYPHAEKSLEEAGITDIDPREIIDIIGKFLIGFNDKFGISIILESKYPQSVGNISEEKWYEIKYRLKMKQNKTDQRIILHAKLELTKTKYFSNLI